MKKKLRNFFKGRYGSDQFNSFLLVISLVLLVLRMIFKLDWLAVFALALIIYCNYRGMSRNISARYGENQAYLRLKNKLLHLVKWFFLSIFGTRGYIFKRCPSCKKELKIPKKKGKIKVTCPHCGEDFEMRT